MAAENQNFAIWQGEDKRIVVTVEDVEDLTGAEAFWRLSRRMHEAAVLEKATGDGIAIDGPERTATVTLTRATTIELDAQSYVHQLWIADDAGLWNLATEGSVTVHRKIPGPS